MANNFRLTGNIYVSKDGSDGNTGLTPDLPKLTIQAGLSALSNNQKLIVGAGYYKETFTRNINVANVALYILADGVVTIEGLPAGTSSLNNTIAGTQGSPVYFYFYNINFIDQNLLLTTTNTGYAQFGTTAYFYDCSFLRNTFAYDIAYTSGTSPTGFNFTRCVLCNCVGITTNIYHSSVKSTLVSSILINTNFAAVPTNFALFSFISNSYIDSNSIIRITLNTSSNFNNIQGRVIMESGNASYNGIALSFADHRVYYPTMNIQSFSADPLFNNVQNLDFTLQTASPHIRAANDYFSNIGGTEYAKHYDADDTEFTSGATITNLTLLGDNSYTLSTNIVAGSFVVGYKYVIVTTGTTDFTLIGAADSNPGTIFTATGVGTGTGTANAVDGNIITAPLAVQSYPATKPLTGIIWNGSLEFNKLVTAGAQGNQNVPAYNTYTTGAGASPDRLKIKMRYSTQSASPTAGQWDNGGYWAVDTYQLVEVNMKPKVDGNGIGNGDYTYIEFVAPGDIIPTWIQLDIKLRNDYNP